MYDTLTKYIYGVSTFSVPQLARRDVGDRRWRLRNQLIALQKLEAKLLLLAFLEKLLVMKKHVLERKNEHQAFSRLLNKMPLRKQLICKTGNKKHTKIEKK
jgi:hypothetical protein